MTAGPDLDTNLAAATTRISDAVDAGADLVVLPELFGRLGPRAVMLEAREPLDGPTMSWAADQARLHGVWLQAGSFLELDDAQEVQAGSGKSDGADGRAFNTSCVFDPTGRRRARYRKIHLFDNDVPGAAYRESDTVRPGSEVVTVAVDDEPGTITVGLTTCYDLRFPELYRALTTRGAQMITVPAAFTAATGVAHWEPLLRARAIENQVYVVAAGQWGETGTGITCHGHSMIVDPWGEVLACQPTGDGIVVARVDLDRLDEIRRRLPSLDHRRPDLA
jgi:predicted amidohydrolase